MRASLALLLAAAGAAAAGAVWLRTSDPLRPSSRESLAERLAVLRLSRALHGAAPAEGTLALRGARTVLQTETAAGGVVLSCEGGPALAAALLREPGKALPSGCAEQAVDGPAEVVLRDVGGSVPALCPAQPAGQTEEQLHDALFLPALAPDDAPGGALQRGALSQCDGDEANCALIRSPGVAIYCGVVRTCAEGACAHGPADLRPEDVATSLYYAQSLTRGGAPARASCGPVSARARDAALVGEAVTAATAGPFADAQPWNLPGLASPGSAATAAAVRRFFARHPRGLCFLVSGLDLDRPRDQERLARGLAYPVFAPADPAAAGRAAPVLRPLQAALESGAALAALLPPCALAGERACALWRERVQETLRASLGHLRPALPDSGAGPVAAHLGATGPFRLADHSALQVVLRSLAGEHAAALTVLQAPLAPALAEEERARCREHHRVCLFRDAASDAAEADPWFLAWLAAGQTGQAPPHVAAGEGR